MPMVTELANLSAHRSLPTVEISGSPATLAPIHDPVAPRDRATPIPREGDDACGGRGLRSLPAST
jgi:hypothetical protein